MNNAGKKQVAIFGFGTVGGGVGEIISKHFSDIEVSKIVVKNVSETDMLGLNKSLFTENHDDVWNENALQNINVIVECIGGTTLAKTIIEKALLAGKYVVTANKAVLAAYGNELLALAKENNVQLKYEAAIAGGIPIVETLNQHCIAGEITKIEGIVNGTCNYMLTELENENGSYAEILKAAQDKGFAEAIPDADVEGWDSADKISLLASLAFETKIVKREEIPMMGISHLTSQDFSEAKSNGKRIRLIASAEKVDGKIVFSVAPQKVDASGKFGIVTGSENIVVIQHEYLGEISLTGAGAGRYPTAVSVVADVVKCCG